MGHDHHHDHHDHHDHSHLSEIELRVRTLESILVEKGYVDPAAIDALVETYEVKVGPATAPRWWRKPGQIRHTGSGSGRMRRPPSPP